jgi:hypothetical protein
MAANKSRFMFDSPCAGRLIQLISASVLVFTGNLPTARATKKGGKTKLRRPAVDTTSPKDFPWIDESAHARAHLEGYIQIVEPHIVDAVGAGTAAKIIDAIRAAVLGHKNEIERGGPASGALH